MLDNLNLIHMNGRVYDPMLGRFTSADPYITEPGNTQNYNRYSYVYNNPLAITDPSGFGGQPVRPDTRGFGNPTYTCDTAGGRCNGLLNDLGGDCTGYPCILFGGGANGDTIAESMRILHMDDNNPYRGITAPVFVSEGSATHGIPREVYEQCSVMACHGNSVIPYTRGWLTQDQHDELAFQAGLTLATLPAGTITNLLRVASITTRTTVIIDSNAVVGLGKDAALGGRLLEGERGVVSYVTRSELRNAVSTGNLRGVPRALDGVDVLTQRPSLDSIINIRGSLLKETGRFGDGIIGAQSVEFGMPLVTNDVELAAAVRALGGTVR